jgi:hypothetical protein
MVNPSSTHLLRNIRFLNVSVFPEVPLESSSNSTQADLVEKRAASPTRVCTTNLIHHLGPGGKIFPLAHRAVLP